MSFIEGVGDEVAAFAVILLVLILAATVTFLLNSTPFSERQFAQSTTTNVSSSYAYQNIENYQQHQEQQSERDRSSQSNGNIGIINSTPSSSSTINNGEVHNVEEAAEPVPDETNNAKVTSEETAANSPIYPTVPQDCDTHSGQVTEESEAENEATAPPDPDQIRIRLKYLNDTERSATSLLTASIGDFKRTHFSEDIANNKVVRLIFGGQRLQDHATLQSYGIIDNCVVHVQVVEAQIPNSSHPSQNTDLDLSHLLWPLLSVILGICWILYFKYPEFFNLMSLGILFLFTGSFVYFYTQMHQQ